MAPDYLRFERIAAHIGAALRCSLAPRPAAPVRGGCIGDSHRWSSSHGTLFVKLAPAAQLPMLEGEAFGLDELARADAVRVPGVRAVGATDDDAYLALEWLELRAPSPATEAELGRRLARQHRVTAAQFGWHRSNHIGATPQVNVPCTDWAVFFREQRLRPQLDLAARNGHGADLQRAGGRLLGRIDALLAGHRPPPALLHGDLWDGNRAATADGPVIFDPAVYYGDREADLAMTRLFGGFGPAFHAAYDASWPPEPGAAARATLYNLYHVLNHLNLFGGHYREEATSMIDALLAPAG
jgi:fructosamine-3-kinase